MVNMSNSSLKLLEFQLFTQDSLAQTFYYRFVVHLQVCCTSTPAMFWFWPEHSLTTLRQGFGIIIFKGKLEINHILLSFFFQFSLSELFKVILGSHHHGDLTAYSTSAFYY